MPDPTGYDPDVQDAYAKLKALGELDKDADAHDAFEKLVKLGIAHDLSGGSTYAPPASAQPVASTPIPTSDPRSPYHNAGFLPTPSGFAPAGKPTSASASSPSRTYFSPPPPQAPVSKTPARQTPRKTPAIAKPSPVPSLAQLATQSALNPTAPSNLTQGILPTPAPTGPQLRQTPQRNLVEQMEQGIFQHDTPILSLYDSAVLTPTYLARAKQAKDRGDTKGAAQALVDLDKARNALGVGSGSATAVGTRAAVNATPGAVGGIAGAAAGGRAGLALSNILPVPPVAKAAIAGAGSLVGMLGGAGLLDAGKAALTRGLVGDEGYDEYLRQQQADEAQNPVASFVGQQVPFAAMMRPANLSTPVKSILAGAGTNAAIDAATQGVDILDARLHGRDAKPFSLPAVGKAAAVGAFFGGGHTPLGESVHNFGEGLVPNRGVFSPAVQSAAEAIQSGAIDPQTANTRWNELTDNVNPLYAPDPYARPQAPMRPLALPDPAARPSNAIAPADFSAVSPRGIAPTPAPFVPSEYAPTPTSRAPRGKAYENNPARARDVRAQTPVPPEVHIGNALREVDQTGLPDTVQGAQAAYDGLSKAGIDTSTLTPVLDNLKSVYNKPSGVMFDEGLYQQKVDARQQFMDAVSNLPTQDTGVPRTPRTQFLMEVARHGSSDATPTVKANVDAVDNAETGRPLTVTGFRQNRGTGAIANTGTFYATDPLRAGSYGDYSNPLDYFRNALSGGNKHSLSAQPLTLDKPFVTEGGHASLLKSLKAQGVPLTPQETNLLTNAYEVIRKSRTSAEGGEAGYQVFDKLAKRFLEKHGYDGIVYRQGEETEVVHFGKQTATTEDAAGQIPAQPQAADDGANVAPRAGGTRGAGSLPEATERSATKEGATTGDRPATPTNGRNAEGTPYTETLATKDIQVLPGMQYKRGVNGKAVTDQFAKQDDFKMEHAGMGTVYREWNADNTAHTDYAVDMHHRLEFINRAKTVTNIKAGGRVNVPREMTVKVLDSRDGWTPDMAKKLGIINNLAENKGEAIDAADALVGRGTSSEIEDARKIATGLQKGQLSRDVQGLVLLGEPGRAMVRNKTLKTAVGAAIGEVLRGDANRQAAALEQAQGNRAITSYDDGLALANAVKEEELAERPTDQVGMFDDDPDAQSVVQNKWQSTAGKQAELQQSVIAGLKQSKSALLNPTKADLMEGENINVAARKAQADIVGKASGMADVLFQYDTETKQARARIAGDVVSGKITNAEGVKQLREIVEARGTRNINDILADSVKAQDGKDTPATTSDTSAPESAGGLFDAPATEPKPAKAAPETNVEKKVTAEPKGSDTFSKGDTVGFQGTPRSGAVTGRIDVLNKDGVSAQLTVKGVEKPNPKYKVGQKVLVNLDDLHSVNEDEGNGTLASHVRTLDAPAPTANKSAAGTTPTARIKPDNIAYDGEALVKPRELIKRLGRVVNAQIRTAKGKGGGSYDPASGATSIRYNGDLDTALHEGAHRLIEKADVDLLGKWKGNGVRAPFDDELIPHFSQYGSVTKSGPRAKLSYARSEGAAEWVRAWMVNPDEAIKAAPKFAAHFEATVPQAVRDQLAEIGREVRRFTGAPAVERGPLAREDVEAQTRTFPELFRHTLDTVIGKPGEAYGDFAINRLDKAQTVVQDSLKPAMKAYDWARNVQGLNGVTDILPQNDFRVLARLVGGVGEKTAEMLETGLVLPSGKQATEGGIKWLLEPFDRTSEASLKRDIRDATTLMIAERTIEKGGQTGNTERVSGIGGGIYSDTAEAKQQIAELQADPERYKKLQEGAARYRQWAKSLLDYQVESGRLSPEARDAYVKNNEYYVDMHRIEEGFDQTALAFNSPVARARGMGSKRIGATGKLNYGFKGSVKEIADPFYSLIDQTYKTHAESDRNAAKIAFRDMFVPKAGAVAGTKTSLGEVMRKADKNSVHTMKVYVDGKEETWDLHPDVYNAINDFMASDSPTAIEKVARFVSAGLLRKAVTSDPGFLIRNVIRDSTERPFKSEVGSNPFGIFSYKALQDANVRTYKLSGAGGSGHYLQSRKGYAQAMKEATAELAREGKGIITTPADLARIANNGYSKLKDGSELVNRIAEFNKAYEYAQQKLGYDERNATLYAAAQARGLMDFAVAGTFGRQVSHYIPFTNANVQGQAAMFKAAKRNPGLFLAKLGILGITCVANLLAIKAFDKSGEKLKEYRDLPSYQRDLFWNIPMPEPIGWLRIPKGFELAVLASGLERATDRLMGNEHALDGYFSDPDGGKLPFLSGTLATNLLPNAIDPDNLGGPFRGLYALTTNYDGFRQKPIIPYYENQKPLEERKGIKTASRVGQGVGALLQSDPRKVDFFIQSQTGGLGKDALLASDLGRKDKYTTPTQYLNIATGLFTEAPGTNAQSVQRVDRQLKAAGVGGKKDPLRPLKDEVFNARSATAKNRAQRNLRAYANGTEVQDTIKEAQARKDVEDDYAGTGAERDDAKAKAMSGRMRAITDFMIKKDNKPNTDQTMRDAGEVAKLQLDYVNREVADYTRDLSNSKLTAKEREDELRKFRSQTLRSLQGLTDDDLRKMLRK